MENEINLSEENNFKNKEALKQSIENNGEYSRNISSEEKSKSEMSQEKAFIIANMSKQLIFSMNANQLNDKQYLKNYFETLQRVKKSKNVEKDKKISTSNLKQTKLRNEINSLMAQLKQSDNINYYDASKNK